MAYTPKTWQCGETIMADDLNHMEQGIAQGGSDPLLIGMEQQADTPSAGYTTYILDKTWQEINDAYPNACLALEDALFGLISKYGISAMATYPQLTVTVPALSIDSTEGITFEASSTDDYPKYVVTNPK